MYSAVYILTVLLQGMPSFVMSIKTSMSQPLIPNPLTDDPNWLMVTPISTLTSISERQNYKVKNTKIVNGITFKITFL